MLKSKFFLVIAVMLLTGIYQKGKSQSNCIGIVLNEVSVGNTGYADNYGLHDAVEIYNNFTYSLSLSGYYLTNDKNNLQKWKFPSTFTLGVGQYGMVYLSGINESKYVGTAPTGTWYHHANFSLDQCKKQYLMLVNSQNVIRDSIYIQQTALGHTWGRVNYCQMGINAWRLYPTHSFPMQNPAVGSYKGYMPIPTFSPQAGWGKNGQTLLINVNGSDADSTNSCNEVHYTIDGSFPQLTDPVYTGTTVPLFVVENIMYRAVNYQKTAAVAIPSLNCLYDNFLPSFCETNTYFSENGGNYDNFTPEFGIMSVAIHSVDTNWATPPNNGASSPTVHVEYFDKKQQIVEGYAVMSRPPQEAWLTKQRGFYLTIDDRRGYGCNFEGNIFNVDGLGTSTRTLFPTLHVKAGDFEAHSVPAASTGTSTSDGTGIRDVFYQSLAAKYNVRVNPLHIKPLILFVNGKYWGVYDLREVYDKNYENYYNPVPGSKDSLDCEFYHNTDGWVVDPFTNTATNIPPLNDFRVNVYDRVMTNPMNNTNNYNTLLKHLDKGSFMDYMIMNSYAMNSNLWNYDIAFAKNGGYLNSGKWHYYLWNMPATFTFQALATNTLVYTSTLTPPCYVQSTYNNSLISTYAGNGHGNILSLLMGTYPGKSSWGNPSFQLEYKNRYQDLLNTALKCENILAHYDYVVNLFKKEMQYHEDPGSAPNPGRFITTMGTWDTNTIRLRRAVAGRCNYLTYAFNKPGCYSMQGPHDLTVDVFPVGAGNVRLNSIVLPFYIWSGRYFNTQISFKAIPTSTNYVFHHWELKNHTVKNNVPLSVDSIAIDFNLPDNIIAVFTDITSDVDIPTGFTPNGDGNNDEFKPLGSALYTKEFEFRIWNRWGQEVFRSTEPAHGWNGTYEGQPAQTGVYAYVISYKNVYGESKIKKGNVTLVR
ncbi:MAG: gliding motility-associated C-terminal domain-containing protein [Bacteroidetes bacterium]|nr:gliding motility-associated C-terminal domain-containing protein [Bacteroidota bacterium]